MAEESYRRPTWDEYFMEVCRTVAKRATCDRGRSGCVIARDNQILVTGYVGSPAGLAHCDDVGHLMRKMIHIDGTISQHCVRTVHAEQNAICQAAKRGITRVVCERHYHDESDSLVMFREAGIRIEHLEDEVQTYKDM